MRSNKCKCKNKKWAVVTEKIYEGCINVNEKDILKCEPETESLIEIKCLQCGKIYKEKDFKDIEY